jgi:hypothetical protein
MMRNKYNQLGSISLVILLFGVVISVAIGGLVIITSTQFSFVQRNQARETALFIAEAGVQYYRWHLAHDPADFTDGQGSDPGPYEHAYVDPQGGVLGTYSLTITPPEPGSSVVTIDSTGWSSTYPGIKRKVKARFGIPSLAQYSFLHNANVWFGSGITVHGKAHSNGGIRQDGINDSIISSSKETYTCGSETGCSPSETKPGVWGTGGSDELWDYPVTALDFDAINIDLNAMKIAAQDTGVYRASASQGYHLHFLDNGTVNIYEVTRTQAWRGYDPDTDCINLNQRIQTEVLQGNYSISDKRIFFLEDNVWVDGVVKGRATVVAAKFPLVSNSKDIWINNNLTYTVKNGDDALGLIAQKNIYFARNITPEFEINAAMIAQNGKIMRHYYGSSSCGGSTSYALRDKLSIYGVVISKEKSYWNWGSPPSSGFTTRDVTYDSNLYLDPPPYFPASGEYEFISWEEVNKD